MEFEKIMNILETKDPIVINAIKEILKEEEKKIGSRNPVGIKDDIKKIIEKWVEAYETKKNQVKEF